MPGPESADPITLAQFLKKVQAADSGGAAKALVRSGTVRVNGADEVRPGRKLVAGDEVSCGDARWQVG